MRLYYGEYKDFNDCALRLVKNYNEQEVAPVGGQQTATKRMQYRDAVKILTVYAYHSAVKFFAPHGVHKQHLTALGLSFLEAAHFFGGEFRDVCFTGPKKPRRRHDRNLVRTDGEGRQTALEELLATTEGIAGRFYMDVDVLPTVYQYMMDQLRFMGEFPRGKHTSTKAWNKAYEKAVDETVEKIGQQLFCQKKILGWPYPACLRPAGYLDYAFPLLIDDPQYRPPGPYQENWAGTLDDETKEAEASEGQGPDVVVEEEITIVYDSSNDPTVACHQPEMSAAELLADILQSSAAQLRVSEEPPTHRSMSGGDSGNLSTNSEMKEVLGGLSLSAQLAGRLGPVPGALPNLTQQAAASTTQEDLKKLWKPNGHSRQLNKAWKDTAEYEKQKGEMENRGRQRNKRSSDQAGRPDTKRSRSRSRPRAPGPKAPLSAMEDASGKKPKLKWIPDKGAEYPVHLVEKKMYHFIAWAETCKLDPRCDETQALRYLVDFEEVTGKVIARLHWSLVYGIMGFRHPVPDPILGLEFVDKDWRSPPDAVFPVRYARILDVRLQARAEWELIASWVQYCFDALQLECWPGLFFSGNARLVSPLVYFILHHVNRVLEMPVRLREILANTGWADMRELLENTDEGKLQEKLYQEEAEASAIENQNKWTDMTMELMARHNFELLQSRVREARKRRDALVRRRQAQSEEERQRQSEMRHFVMEQRAREQRQHEREQRERKKHRETDLERDRRHRRSDKEHRDQVRAAKAKAEKLPPRIPPDEKTLTVKMPQTMFSTQPLPLRRTAPSADGSSSSEQPAQPSSAPASPDAQMSSAQSSDAHTPSPTKTPKDADELEEFNELNEVDPLAEMRELYLPDRDVPSPPTEAEEAAVEGAVAEGTAVGEAYNPRHIEAMEADYEGQHSSREDRHSGQYGEPQSYHIVPSPPRLVEEEELSGPSARADTSPSTEAQLLAESPHLETQSTPQGDAATRDSPPKNTDRV